MKKDRLDRQAAMGILQDPELVNLVLGGLPNWTKDADTQRVAWLNTVLDKVWPHVCTYVDNLLKDIVQPLLDQYRPPGFTDFTMEKAWLGPTGPKILGARVHTLSTTSVILDLELQWIGDPEVRVYYFLMYSA